MIRLTPTQIAMLAASLDRIIESHIGAARDLPRADEAVESKEAVNRHAAGRAALAHLDHVMKAITSYGAAPNNGQPSAGEALAAARAEIDGSAGPDAPAEESPDPDDEGQPG